MNRTLFMLLALLVPTMPAYAENNVFCSSFYKKQDGILTVKLKNESQLLFKDLKMKNKSDVVYDVAMCISNNYIVLKTQMWFGEYTEYSLVDLSNGLLYKLEGKVVLSPDELYFVAYTFDIYFYEI